MGTGYTRNDTLNNIADGNIINASDLDGEYDAIESAFNESTGHTHDGTAAEGAPITVLGPVQDFVASATEIKPKTTNTLDIGTLSLQFKDMYLDGTAYIDGLGEDILVATDKKVQFRDTALFINSSADGQLDIDADVEVEITAPTLDIDASTAVTIDTATLTITGSANVVGDLDVDNININGNTIISTDTNGNIALTPDGTGEVDISKVDIASGEIDGTTIGANSAAAITGTTITGTSFVSSGDMTFGDNDKAIFGAGSDLQIYHDGANSVIDDTGSGRLYLRSDPGVIISKYTGEVCAQFNADADVKLYYDNAEKLATTSTGVDVTGDIAVDRVVNSGVASTASTPTYTWGGQQALTGMYLPASSVIAFSTNGTERLRIASNGNVGIGTDSPSANLEIDAGAGAGTHLQVTTTGSGHNFDMVDGTGTARFRNVNGEMRLYGDLNSGGNGNIIFHAQGTTEAMRIDSDGVKFNGDTAAANALDDYEEGTWTCTPSDASGNNSPTTASGTYTKIGNMVHLKLNLLSNIDTTGLTSSNTFRLNGLPFAVNGGTYAGSCTNNSVTYTAGRTQVIPRALNGQTYFVLTQQGSGVSSGSTAVVQISSGTTDITSVSIVYQTA